MALPMHLRPTQLEAQTPMQSPSEVILYDEEGHKVTARPFFLTRFGKSVLPMELYSDNGCRIRCLDHLKGLYRCGNSGRLLQKQRRKLTGDSFL